jgi:imidazolonepropionase-like amidohydrolase
VHSYGPAAVADALRAGVDSIEHPVGLDDQLLEQWAASDTIYVPTIDHNRYYADHRDEYGYDEAVESELHEFVQRNVETLRRAHRAGLTIAMGSDAVMSGFGQNTRELEWFVEAGMTPAQAIQTATVNGALLLGQEEFLGRLKFGFAADIVAVEGDPLRDIRALTQNVKWVMKNGEVVVDQVGEERAER